jgi:hypothetical protein
MDTQLAALARRLILAALVPSFLFGCATMTPSRFTSENITSLHQGMTTTEVEKLFGPADSIRNTLCGKEDKWQCEIWSYNRQDNRYLTNTFWFSVTDGRRLLNQWDVTRGR